MNYNNTAPESGRPDRRPRRFIYPVALVTLSVLMLALLMPGLIIAFKAYTVQSGAVGSPWVGGENFAAVLGQVEFGGLARASGWLKVLEIIFGVVPGALLGLVCTLPKKRGIKAALGGLCLTPAGLPYAALYAAYVSAGVLGEGASPELAYALVACPRIMGVTAFVCAMFAALGENPLRGVLYGALIMIALKFTSAFTPSVAALMVTGGNSFDITMYELAVGQGELSQALALYWLKAALQLLPALAGAGVLGGLLGGNAMRAQVRIGERDSGWTVSTFALPLATCIIVIIYCALHSSPDGFFSGLGELLSAENFEVGGNYIQESLLTAGWAAALVLLLALSLRAAATGRNGRAYGFGALVFITLAYPVVYQMSVGQATGIYGTRMGVALGALMRSDTILPVFAVCALSFGMDSRASGRYIPAIMAALFVAAVVWGDAFSAQMFGAGQYAGAATALGTLSGENVQSFMSFWSTFPALILCACASGCAIHLFSGRE